MNIGITGGIGSGKTVVSKVLETMGYAVFNSDQEAKIIVNTDPVIVHGLKTLFGEEVYIDGLINKPMLADIIFSNDEVRVKVNDLIHPRVREAYDDFSSIQSSGLVFNEAAILFETDAYKRFDKLILVTSPREIRIQRIRQRDNCSKEEVEARMSKQWSDEQKIPLADFIIENNENSPLLVQIEAVVNQLISV
ncbi:MAG: dephospho-CoA kinase [Crocinitomicaceae bacterium]|nr:dephospho-CoA kinase [Crocinitomicaceae bacterium]